MRILSYIAVMFTLLFAACSGGADKDVNEKMELANAIVNDNPDSAMRILEEIDKQGLSEHNLAHYALLYTIAQDKSGLDVDDDSLLRFAHEYYSANTTDSMYARYAYYMGKYYLLNDSDKIAHDMLRTSADVAKERNEYYTACLALGKLTKSLSHINPQVAIEYAKDVVDIHCNYPTNTRNHILSILDIGECFVFMGEMDSALVHMRQALNLAEHSGDSASVASAYKDIAATFNQWNMADSALVYALKMAEYQPRLSDAKRLMLGSALYGAGRTDEAEILLKEIVENPKSKQRYSSYKLLCRIALEQGDAENLYAYMDSANRTIEDKYQDALAANADYYDDNLAKELENEHLKTQSTLRAWIMGGGIIILVLLLILSYFIYQNRKYRSERLMELEKERSRMQAEFTEKEHQKQMEHNQAFYEQKMDYERQRYESELQQRSNQIDMMRSFLVRKTDVLHKLNEFKANTDKRMLINDEDWNEIKVFLENVDNLFVTRLVKAFPNLTSSDIEFCMLVRLELTTPCIARIYCRNEQYMKQKLLHFKSKVGIADSKISFREFITNF